MKRFVILNVFLASMLAGGTNAALAALKFANNASYVFEQTVSTTCAQATSGAARNKCIGTAMDKLVVDIQSGVSDINIVAPPAVPALKRAASQVNAAKSKAAGTTALNRVQSVVRDLAAKSSGEASLVYNRLNQAMAKAQSVIEAGT